VTAGLFPLDMTGPFVTSSQKSFVNAIRGGFIYGRGANKLRELKDEMDMIKDIGRDSFFF
jgi:hypothetical protein